MNPVCHVMIRTLLTAVALSAFAFPTRFNGADGFYVGRPLHRAEASVEGSSLVLRLPVTLTVAPKARGILLFDAEPGVRLNSDGAAFFVNRDKSARQDAYTVQVLLEKPLGADVCPRFVLDGKVFWEVESGNSLGEHQGGWLSFGVGASDDAVAILRAAGALLRVPQEHQHDLRLTAAQQAQSAEVEGNLSPSEIEEIRQTTFLMARRWMVGSLLEADLARWPEILKPWPGRYPLRISASQEQAAVYYAPNAGYQFGKRERHWVIVGG